jgi:hypothetical protein
VQGTRIYRDPFANDTLSSAFTPDCTNLHPPDPGTGKLEKPLWWLTKEEDGAQILHATLTDPGVLFSDVHGHAWLNGV